MIFGWEVDDLGREQRFEKVRNAGLHFPPLTSLHVVIIHIRESILEFQRNPFPHDADAIDRVDQRLGFRLENVADKDSHGYLLEEHSTVDHDRQSGPQCFKDLQRPLVRHISTDY